MRAREADAVAVALGRRVVSAARLAGGYQHETSLLTLDGGGQVVARLGGPDPAATVIRDWVAGGLGPPHDQ